MNIETKKAIPKKGVAFLVVNLKFSLHFLPLYWPICDRIFAILLQSIPNSTNMDSNRI